MNALVRTARPEDAAVIVSVAGEVWPEEPLGADAIGRLIGEGARATVVAEMDGRIVGFVDGFLTETIEGDARWEVDLLAVSPAAQGRGIGRALVQACVEAGMRAGAVTTRGLIRIGNVVSERVFASCGFRPDDGVSQLWTSVGLTLPPDTGGMRVVPVQTFRYEGIWLEAVTPAALRELHRSHSAGVTGAVISIDDHATSALAAAAGMERDGQFRFWRRALRSSGG